MEEFPRVYEDLVNSLDGIVREADAADFRFTFVSRQCERLLGYTPRQWLNELTWKDVIHPEDLERVYATCVKAVEERRNHALEYRMLAADGRVVWVRDIATVIVESGRPIKLCGVLLEITERKWAEESLRESEKRFRSVIQSAIDAIVLADSGGKIIGWNRAAQTIFGYGEQDVFGQPLTILMPERYREAHRKGIERMRAGSESRIIGSTVELHGLRKDGSEFPLELSIGTWRTAEGVFYSGIIRDISERKRAEEERERLILQLQAALARIKVLSGLLPICATCKKIRDDKGYWKQLEDYIMDHSEAQFTHGICTECARKLHPDWDEY